jgi:hypothetical protein
MDFATAVGLAKIGTRLDVELLGERIGAVVAQDPQRDPKGERVMAQHGEQIVNPSMRAKIATGCIIRHKIYSCRSAQQIARHNLT